MATVTVDCAQAKGEADTIQTIAESINTSSSGPTHGISTKEYTTDCGRFSTRSTTLPSSRSTKSTASATITC